MTVIIKKCTVADLVAEPNFAELLDRYADELHLSGLPRPCAKIETYKKLEYLGMLHPIGAYLDGNLIGFINVLIAENPHYGLGLASTESFFVLKEYRKTGAGNLLRREAEKYAEKLGSPAIFITGHGNLSMALEGSKDYSECGRVFYKRLGNE